MSLSQLLSNPQASIGEIGAYLDALDAPSRWADLDTLSGKQLRLLFERAASAPPITRDFFVPAGVGAGVEVIHDGKNSLPLFRRFQKRFCRPQDGSPRLFGYNEGSTRPWIGPGYFVAHDSDGQGWSERGAVVVDYWLTPDGPVVEGWPEVVSASRGLQFFVYHHTRDFMRPVSKHVSIGAAYKNEMAMGAYFVLCRQDP